MNTFLQQIVNGLSLGSIYALIALGYTMVYGVLRLINFAHGDVYMVGAYVGYALSRKLAGGRPSFISAFLVMLGAMAVCAVLGLVIERLAYRPLRRAARLALLVTAIGVSLLIEYSWQLFVGPDPKFFEEALADDAVLVSQDGQPFFAKTKVVEAHEQVEAVLAGRHSVPNAAVADGPARVDLKGHRAAAGMLLPW